MSNEIQAIATRWWWVRHAPVVGADSGRLSGQNDVPADLSDRAAFAFLAPQLPQGAAWLTTPLQRTRQTAEALWAAGADRAEPAIEPAFQEQAFGDWTGMTWTDIARRPESEAFWADAAHAVPPNAVTGRLAESFADVCRRVTRRMDELTVEFAGRDIVCVAHAGSIRAAVAHALGLTPEQALALDVQNTALTRLDHFTSGLKTLRGGNWRVVALNRI
ncbi:MAG: histidine phosphatase family protein [Alphaproteobacteria bacterium]|nr:histidine phosphatase family protein [Alphaproteobacteria bacterium]MBF0250740.1 histidine phosphatase family protein [Alphaproteobacteria bacterium]